MSAIISRRSASNLFSVCNRLNQTKRLHSASYIIYRTKKLDLDHNKCLLANTNSISFSNYRQTSSFHWLIENYTSLFQSISESKAVSVTQNLLVDIHDYTGLPWWGTVVVSTVLLRSIITTPLALYQQHNVAKLEKAKMEFMPMVKELQKELDEAIKLFNWSPAEANYMYRRSFNKHWKALIERDNCHPAKGGVVVLFQLPLWIFLSMSIRNLVSMRPHFDEDAALIHSQLQNESVLWISDLTVADTSMMTSTVLCLVNLSIIEVNRLLHMQQPTRMQRILVNMLRALAFSSFWFALIVPSGVSFYWLTSSTFGLVQNLALMSPKVKRLAGIPLTPTTKLHPYSHIWKQIQIRLKISPVKDSQHKL